MPKSIMKQKTKLKNIIKSVYIYYRHFERKKIIVRYYKQKKKRKNTASEKKNERNYAGKITNIYIYIYI